MHTPEARNQELPKLQKGGKVDGHLMFGSEVSRVQGDVPLVVYLARRWYGPSVLAAFLDSYRAMSEKMPHRLLIIWKGFSPLTIPINPNHLGLSDWFRRTAHWVCRNRRAGTTWRRLVGDSITSTKRWFDLSEYPPLLAGIDTIGYEVKDVGFDIGPYLQVAERFEFPSYLFLNSSSRFQAPDWLTKLSGALNRAPRAGIVGATGSWEKGNGPTFPNPHIRTNGFMVAREVLRKVQVDKVRTKSDCELFEHGACGLTRQIIELGFQPYVVGRNGDWYEAREWKKSNTFRSRDCGNLLIRDNRTDSYLSASPADRAHLAALAWGSPE